MPLFILCACSPTISSFSLVWVTVLSLRYCAHCATSKLCTALPTVLLGLLCAPQPTLCPFSVTHSQHFPTVLLCSFLPTLNNLSHSVLLCSFFAHSQQSFSLCAALLILCPLSTVFPTLCCFAYSCPLFPALPTLNSFSHSVLLCPLNSLCHCAALPILCPLSGFPLLLLCPLPFFAHSQYFLLCCFAHCHSLSTLSISSCAALPTATLSTLSISSCAALPTLFPIVLLCPPSPLCASLPILCYFAYFVLFCPFSPTVHTVCPTSYSVANLCIVWCPFCHSVPTFAL